MSTSIFELRNVFLARQVRCHFIWDRDAAQAGIPVAIQLCDEDVTVYPPSSRNGWIWITHWAGGTTGMLAGRDAEWIATRILTRIKERRDAL